MMGYLAVLLVISTARSAAPKAEEPKVFPKTAFALPLLEGIHMDWVFPPSLAELKGRAKTVPFRFDVDPQGNPWFISGKERMLTSPTLALLYRTPKRFDDSVFLEGGAQLFCAGGALAIPRMEDKSHAKVEGEALQVELRSFLRLDGSDCRLFSGGKNLLYIVQRDGKIGKDVVMTLRSGDGAPAKAEKILSTKERITALAGDGDKTYFALGGAIMELTKGDAEAKVFYKPEEPATSLAYSASTGLFYATSKHAGFAGPSFQMTFLTSPNPEIALRGDALYLRLSRTMAVLKIGGASLFKTLAWKSGAPN